VHAVLFCFQHAQKPKYAPPTLGTAELESESWEELPQEKQHTPSSDTNQKPTDQPATGPSILFSFGSKLKESSSATILPCEQRFYL